MKKDENYLGEQKNTPIVLEVGDKTIELTIPDLPKKGDVGRTEVINFPETQRVEVVNLPMPPEVQSVEVKNLPDVQRVTVENQVEVPEVQKVEVQNYPEPFSLPDIIKVEVQNALKEMVVSNLPTGKGNNGKNEDPTYYVNVRLTDGDRFYKAVERAIASAGGSEVGSTIGNYVQAGKLVLTGAEQQVSVTKTRLMNGVTLQAYTTNSGSLYVGPKNNQIYELPPGGQTAIALLDLSNLYVKGSAGDILAFISTN